MLYPKLCFNLLLSRVLLILFLLYSLPSFTQVNIWKVHEDAVVGSRSHYAVNYIPSEGKFLLNMGSYAQINEHPYTDMVFDSQNKRWINNLPDSLYGVWADSTGNTIQANLFNGYYFEFREERGHLIPQLIHNRQATVHKQYALNSKESKVYYYVHGKTFSYDPMLKEYEEFETELHPSIVEGKTGSLKWGTMCYDPINDEVLLIGGAGIDAEGGHAGFWAFSMLDKQWHPKDNNVIPPPRAYSNMVYDPQKEKILLFGGDHLDFMYSDTWVYDCNTQEWLELNPVLSPSPRGGHLMLYSHKSNKVFLLGGYEYHVESGIDYLSALYHVLPQLDLWVYDWENISWNLIKIFDYNETTPKALVSKPHYLIGDIDMEDHLLIVSDGTSQYTSYPRTYEMTVGLDEVDSVLTEINGVVNGTTLTRKGPYDPSYFEDNPIDLEVNFYDSMPLDTWVRVPVGEDRYPENNRDWGTTVFDPDRNLFYKWSGGHSAHCGTDVPMFNPEKAHWELPYFGDFPLEYVYANGSNPGFYSFNDRPFMNGHSYDSYDYDVNLKKMIMFSGRYTYTFNAELGDWDSLKVENPEWLQTSIYHISLTSTKHGVVFWITNLVSPGSPAYLLIFNKENMQWDQIIYQGPGLPSSYCDKAGAVYDSYRDRMIFASFDSQNDSTILMAYNFMDNSTELLSPDNPLLAQTSLLREALYIPSLDIVLYQGEVNDKYKLIYNCTENTWDSLLINKSNGVGSTNTRSSGYMYDTQRNIIYNCEANCEVYALRLSGSFADTMIVGINLESPSDQFKPAIYPNPSTGVVQIDMRPIQSVQVYSSLGRLVHSSTNSHKVDLSNHPKGIYYFKIKKDNQHFIVKFVLE